MLFADVANVGDAGAYGAGEGVDAGHVHVDVQIRVLRLRDHQGRASEVNLLVRHILADESGEGLGQSRWLAAGHRDMVTQEGVPSTERWLRGSRFSYEFFYGSCYFYFGHTATKVGTKGTDTCSLSAPATGST